MLNLVRADLYRLAHGKTLWITALVLALFSLLVGTGRFSPNFRMTLGSHRIEQVTQISSGAQAPYALLSAPEFLILLFLPILIVVACTSFTSGAIKNTLTRGNPRSLVYLSKLLLSCAIGVVFDFLQIVLALISGTIALGFGRPLNWNYFGNLASAFLLQLPLYFGVISIGVCLVFLFWRPAIVSVVYLVIFAAADLWGTAQLLVPGQHPWLRYELLSCLKQAASLPGLAVEDIVRIAALGTGYLIVMGLLGILIFQKRDIP